MALAEKARRRFRSYCEFMDPQFECPPHIELLCNALEEVERGEVDRLLITMPPRHGKSDTSSRKFPAWFLGRNPDLSVIMSSYGYTLTKGFSRDVRDAIESRWYRLVFDITTRDDARMVNDFDIDGHRGGLLAQGVGGAVTGHGANLFLIDDPIKNQKEADSITYRDMIWNWYRSVALTRLEPGARIVLILTRWHRDDLAGRILAEEKGWKVINLPALAVEPREGVPPDPLGRKPGEALWPKRYSAEELRKKAPGGSKSVGSRVWEALFQGNPQDAESQKFKRAWFQWYDNLPVDQVRRGGGIDTATSKADAACDSSLVDVVLCEDKHLYVDDVFLEKVTVSGFGHYVVNQHLAKKYRKIHLESNNAGEAFYQRIVEISQEESVKRGEIVAVPVEAIATSTDKMVRAMEFQHLVENGTLRFRRGSSKIAALVEHLINFDGVGGDIQDDVDALGFAIKAALKESEGGAVDLGDVMPE